MAPLDSASELANETAASSTPSAPVPSQMAEVEPAPLWAKLFMPSLTDLIFLLTFWFLTFGFWGMRLLGDAGTGWHIRNGEHILAARSVPHADYFSYTMAGKPWFAWEWLYDVGLAVAHKLAGLNGVVVLSASVIALTFALLFRISAKLSGNVVVAAVLTIISFVASSIHFLARPHLATWLFVLVWFTVLDDFRRNARWRVLLCLPFLMLSWVNLHGGFLLGLVLPVIFASAGVWTAVTCSCPKKRARSWTAARRLGIATLGTVIATFANPYGYKLYVHLKDYLGSHFLMDNISEFLSPDFHWVQVKFFLLLLLAALAALALTPKPRAIDLLIVAFAACAGLYAARNIPIACILLTLSAAPLLSAAISSTSERSDLSFRTRRISRSFTAFSSRMKTLENQFFGHALPLLLVAATIAICLNHGRIGSRQLLNLQFDSKAMPVQAADYLMSNSVRDSVFSTDAWGGYLIYRLHPQFKVFIDDRHDFYGEPFVKDYLDAVHLRPKWREVLDTNRVKYVLLPPDSPLAVSLRSSADWKVVEEDATALLLARSNDRPAR